MMRARVLFALAYAAASVGCSARPEASAATADSAGTGPLVGFVTVESTTVTVPLLLPAQLYVERDAVVAARTAGVLRSLSVDLGAPVRAGQVLGGVEDDVQRLAQERATVALERARQMAWRAREMRAGNNIPATEAEDAEFALRDAEVSKREADVALERTTIVAPFDGVVTGRFVQPGRLLSLNDSVVRITARGPYLARIRLPDASVHVLRPGADVLVEVVPDVAARPARRRSLRGAVWRLSPAIDAASGTREVIVRITTVTDDLMPGLAVEVQLPQDARRAITVPLQALHPDGYVVVQQGRRAVMRLVTIGDTIGDTIGRRVEIRSGLTVGERVRPVARVESTVAAPPR